MGFKKELIGAKYFMPSNGGVYILSDMMPEDELKLLKKHDSSLFEDKPKKGSERK